MTFLYVDVDKTATAFIFADDTDFEEGFKFVLGGDVVRIATDSYRTQFVMDVWVNSNIDLTAEKSHNQLSSFLTGQYLRGPAIIANINDDDSPCGLPARDIYRLEQDCKFTLQDNNGVGFIVDIMSDDPISKFGGRPLTTPAKSLQSQP